VDSLILLLGSCKRGCYKGSVDFCLKVLLAIDSGYLAFVHFQEDAVVANSRGPRTAGRGAKYRGLPVRRPKSNSRGPRTFF